MSTNPLYLGIDLGTGGVRALAVTPSGDIAAASSVSLAAAPEAGQTLPAGHHEQDALDWWRATQQAVAAIVAVLRDRGITGDAIAALAVDGTSGTVVGVDAHGRPVGPALMYNDARAVDEARELAACAAAAGPSPGGQVTASYALAKIRWLQRHQPRQFAAARRFVHQADYIAARLTGRWGVTDSSNALKTGYDLLAEHWPAWLNSGPLAAIRARLPEVLAPGTVVGTVCRETAAGLGLSPATRVVAGATDGTAAFLASGACAIGDDNTTLGTTLVFKRVAAAPVLDRSGLVYCHKLPGGLWLPGGASNTGGEWMARRFPGADYRELDRAAAARLPCPVLAYPLARTGERLPFRAECATGFCEPASGAVEEYAAHLQGTALLERRCYEILDAMTGRPAGAPGAVFATGGGSRSDVWVQLRADLTGRVYHRPACPESAFGAAVLAAGADQGGADALRTAIRRMVRSERRFDPDDARRAEYDTLYARFIRKLQEEMGAGG